jgi:glycosyltransferase involved in cell wall biosynthesis
VISIIILTYNEEENLVATLESIKDFTDDIIIVDSYSKDKTKELCESYGCQVFENPFINQAIQFNWALDHVPIKYDWVMRMDSDEILPLKLQAEIKSRVGQEADINGYYLNRRMYWMNHWLRYGRMYPHYILRIFKKGEGRYEEKTEEHLLVKGNIAFMKNDFLEDNRKNNLDYFTEKHLSTARGELAEIIKPTEGGDFLEANLFGNKINRTRWFKEKVYSRVPLFVRPFLYFIYRYFFCFGFLDGLPGLTWHILQGFWYRFYIDAKVYENKSEWQKKRNDYSHI